MKKIIFLSLLLILVSKVYSQKDSDYEKYRKQVYGLSCENTTKEGVDSSLSNLLKIDTIKISNGLEFYYNDLGMIYYDVGRYYKDKRKEYFIKSIDIFKKNIALDKLKSESYYMIAFLYDGLNIHKQAKEYLILYKKHTKRRYWDKDLIKSIEEAKNKIFE